MALSDWERVKSSRLLCDPDKFDEYAYSLKDEGADFVTLSAGKEKDGSVSLHYFFEKQGSFLILEIKLQPGETMPSLYSRFQKADFIEREIYKTFNIKFVGHPNLERITT